MSAAFYVIVVVVVSNESVYLERAVTRDRHFSRKAGRAGGVAAVLLSRGFMRA